MVLNRVHKGGRDMLIGPEKILACPSCAKRVRLFTLVSGNTFGALRWTDGKMSAPMLPEPPSVTRCEGCEAFFWVEDVEVVGELDFGRPGIEEAPEEWTSAPQVRELSADELLEAIASGVARTREEELHLRMLAWWAGNDPVRACSGGESDSRRGAPEQRGSVRENMERLWGLVDPTDLEERLIKAELARELGWYADAIRLLEFDFPPEYAGVSALIRRLAAADDPRVALIESE